MGLFQQLHPLRLCPEDRLRHLCHEGPLRHLRLLVLFPRPFREVLLRHPCRSPRPFHFGHGLLFVHLVHSSHQYHLCHSYRLPQAGPLGPEDLVGLQTSTNGHWPSPLQAGAVPGKTPGQCTSNCGHFWVISQIRSHLDCSSDQFERPSALSQHRRLLSHLVLLLLHAGPGGPRDLVSQDAQLFLLCLRGPTVPAHHVLRVFLPGQVHLVRPVCLRDHEGLGLLVRLCPLLSPAHQKIQLHLVLLVLPWVLQTLPNFQHLPKGPSKK